MRVLVLAPQFDVPTTISTAAVIELVQWLSLKRVPTDFLWGPAVSRGLFENKVNEADLVCYYGHGVEYALVGNYLWEFMLDTDNHSRVTKPKIIYTMACLTGLKLGPAMAPHVSYFGHTTYYYAAFAEPDYNYLKDWNEYVQIIPKLIIEGKSAGDALATYRSHMTGLIDKYTREKKSNWDWYVDVTRKNRDFTQLFGGNATLS